MAYMLVTATLDDFDDWKADFERYHDRRAEHGSQGYHLLQDVDDSDRITVLIEFDTLENARSWQAYLKNERAMEEGGMTDVEIGFHELIERQSTTEPVA